MSNKVKWTANKRFWQKCHSIVNRLAWRFVPTKDYLDPRNKHWLWRFNTWVGNHYTLWYVEQVTGHKVAPNNVKDSL